MHPAVTMALIVWLVGLVIYLIAAPARISEVGKIMFWTGLLAWLLSNPWVHRF
jgi:hypothetical protein